MQVEFPDDDVRPPALDIGMRVGFIGSFDGGGRVGISLGIAELGLHSFLNKIITFAIACVIEATTPRMAKVGGPDCLIIGTDLALDVVSAPDIVGSVKIGSCVVE